MKLKITLCAIVFLAIVGKATAQNIFPEAGNVGINVASPVASLQIKTVDSLGGNALQIDPFFDAAGEQTGQMRFMETSMSGTNYIGFKAPYSLENSFIWTLPPADGTEGQVLVTDGYGKLSFRNEKKSANQTLSNLKYPTSINQSLLPNGSGFLSLGTEALPWNYGYFSSSLYADGGIIIQDAVPSTAGAIRYSGSDFEGYNGSEWVSFTEYSVGANTSLSNLTSTDINVNLLPDLDNTRDLGYLTSSWRNIYADGALYLNGNKFLWRDENNIYMGPSSGSSNSGTDNTFLGAYSGVENTIGSSNTFVGYHAGNQNTDGENNTFLGAYAGEENITGERNTAIGTGAMALSASANYNVAIGYNALRVTEWGEKNVAIGDVTLENNTYGYGNVAVGWAALNNNIDGSYNIALGQQCLVSNEEGDDNIAAGFWSMFYNTIGSENTAYGQRSLFYNTTGSFNCANGSFAMTDNKTGSYNTAMGHYAGDFRENITNGSFFGYNTYTSSDNLINVSAFGYNARPTASNQVRIGNSSVTSIGGYAGWTNLSDERYKNNVKEDVKGLDFIMKLRPVTYNLEVNKLAAFLGEDVARDTSGNKITTNATSENKIARDAKEEIRYTGFLAQEVEAAAKESNYDFSGVDVPKNETDLYGLRYAEFVVPMVKAIQEQQTEIETLLAEKEETNSTIEDLQNDVEILKEMVRNLTAGTTPSSENNFESFNTNEDVITTEIILSAAWLDQNVPNPFTGNTSIRCYIPEDFTSAQMVITSQNGVVLKTNNLESAGINEVLINAQELSAGNYQYTLIIDGRIIATKTMVLTK